MITSLHAGHRCLPATSYQTCWLSPLKGHCGRTLHNSLNLQGRTRSQIMSLDWRWGRWTPAGAHEGCLWAGVSPCQPHVTSTSTTGSGRALWTSVFLDSVDTLHSQFFFSIQPYELGWKDMVPHSHVLDGINTTEDRASSAGSRADSRLPGRTCCKHRPVTSQPS